MILGSTSIDTLKLGSSQVSKIYLGSAEVWSDYVAPPGSETFLVSGTFTVPAGYNQVTVTMCGGGGAGATYNGVGGTFAGGGYAGQIIQQTVTVSPGEEITVTIGSGAIANYTSGTSEQFVNGTSGTASNFEAASGTITANGGIGGICHSTSSNYKGNHAELTTALGTNNDGYKNGIWVFGGQTAGLEPGGSGTVDGSFVFTPTGLKGSGGGGGRKNVPSSTTQYKAGDGGDGVVIVSWS